MSVKDREDIFNECCLLRSMCLQVLDRARQLDSWDNSATSAEILDAAEYLVRRVTERRDELARGLCQACYRLAHDKVQSEEVTWDNLVQRGLAKDARVSAFKRAFSKSK